MSERPALLPQHYYRQYARMKKWLIGLLLVVIALLVALAVFVIGPNLQPMNTSTLPVDTVAKANFRIYYPGTIPENYTLDQKSVSLSGELFVYTLKNDRSSSYITISQQPSPENVNLESILRHPNKEPSTIRIGTLYDRSSNGQSTYAIVTQVGTLIYITPSNSADNSAVRLVIDSLR